MSETLRCPMVQIKSDITKLRNDWKKNTNMLKKIMKVDPRTEETEYGKFLISFYESADKTITQLEEDYDEIEKLYEEVCDWYFLIIP